MVKYVQAKINNILIEQLVSVIIVWKYFLVLKFKFL